MNHNQGILDCGGKRSITPFWYHPLHQQSGVAASLCHRSPRPSRPTGTSTISGIRVAAWITVWAVVAALPPHLSLADTNLTTTPPPAHSPDARSFRQTIWTAEQGLPNNSILALLQTRDGYLWIGTAGGLARFDGLRFTVFRRSTHPAMVNDDCRALAEGRDGTLWIGTANGLLRYDDGQFQRFTPEDGLQDGRVRALVASRNYHEIWIVTMKGLACWRDGMLRRYTVADLPNFYEDHSVLAVGEDLAGKFWANDEPALRSFDREADQFRDDTLSRHYEKLGIKAIFNDKPQSYWLARESTLATNLLYHYDHGITSSFPQPKPSNLAGDAQFIVADRAGNLWLSAGRFGLDCFRDGRFTRFTSADGLSDTWVRSFFADREGNLWIGTERGLNCWRPRRIRAYSVSDGLIHDSAWTLCETRDGSLWIGTDGGLSRLQNGRFTSYTERDGLTKGTVRALAEDADGGLWIGSGGGGIDLFFGDKFANLRLPGELSGNKVRALHRGRDGAMWVGTELGVHRFQAGQWRHWTTADGLPHNDVRAVRATRDGAVWLGTFGGGVCVLGAPSSDSRGNSVPAVRGSSGDVPIAAPTNTGPPIRILTTTNGLPSDFAWAFHEDADGGVWIGTEGGLSRWQNGRLFSFTRTQGLAENIINEILEDDSGHLWLSGEEGLYRVARRGLEAVAEGRALQVNVAAYGEADGLLSRESNGQKSQPAGCRCADGTLWFPTTKGIVAIDPRTGILNEVPPPVVIEQVRADEEMVHGDGEPRASNLASNPPFVLRPSPLRLPPGRARVMEFNYTANSFVAPELVRFRYRLEGHDEEWTDAGDRRVAYYTGLRPGDYRFRVTARNHHGVWSDTGASFAFSLAPYFHQTGWFYTVCALGVVGAGYGLHRLRLRGSRRLQALEHQLALERERARIAQDIHDSVGANLTQINLWTELASRNLEPPHPARPHVARADSTARAAYESLSEIVWAINPQNDTLRSLLAYLRRHAQASLEAAAIQLRFDWPQEIPDGPVTAEQRHHLFLVVQEALHNVIQHAAATEMEFAARIEPTRLRLRLQDNGRGFDPHAVSDGGNGLANMAKRVADLGGNFQLTSQPGCGTEITVEIPLALAPPTLTQSNPP